MEHKTGTAQQLSSRLALESERASFMLREGKMTEKQVLAFLKQCFLAHQSKLRSLTVLALDSGAGMDVADVDLMTSSFCKTRYN